MGNPKLDNPSLELPFAEQEVRVIATLFETEALTNEEATLATLRQQWEQADILHLACHAQWDARQPEFSALLLAPGPQDSGRLEVQELFALDHDLSLSQVTLSACQTSLGAGSDVTGLATGFLYAGAPAVIASLWRVDDISTSELMAQFYHELTKKDRAAALRCAQLSLLRLPARSHPYFWAAFNLIGSPLRLESDRVHTASAFQFMHLWTYRSPTGFLSYPSIRDTMLLAIWWDSADNNYAKTAVYAISFADKRLCWKQEIPSLSESFCWVPGLVHVNAVSKVCALRASDGEIVWEHATGANLTQTMHFDGKLLYMGGCSRSVYAVRPETGEIEWEHQLPRPGSGGFAVGNGCVFVGCNDHFVYALSATTGRLLWRCDLGWREWETGLAWVRNGLLETEIGTFEVASGEWNVKARIEKKILQQNRVPKEMLDRLPRRQYLIFDDVALFLFDDLFLLTNPHDWNWRESPYFSVLDMCSGKLLRRYKLPSTGVSSVSYEGKLVVIGDKAGALHCFLVNRARREGQ